MYRIQWTIKYEKPKLYIELVEYIRKSEVTDTLLCIQR
jgi:hypothetical protein